jgi:hypothetical protein
LCRDIHTRVIFKPEILKHRIVRIENCFDGKSYIVQTKNESAIVINSRNISIVGLNITSENGYGIVVSADNSRVYNNKIFGCRIGVGISLENNRNILKNILIENNEIENNKLVGVVLNEERSNKSYENIVVKKNVVKNNGNHGIRVRFTQATGGTSTAKDLEISDNEIMDNKNDGITVVHDYVNVKDPLPLINNIKIKGNLIYRNAGGILLWGISSENGKYGDNVIRQNECCYNKGAAGGMNIFASRYIDIYENKCDGNSPNEEGIDGNGILVDHGNSHIRIYKNELRNNHGTSGVDNSGAGLMVLDSSDILVCKNTIGYNKIGIYIGGKGVSANIVIIDNDILNNYGYNYYVDTVADDYSITLDNNLISEDKKNMVKNPKAFSVEKYCLENWDVCK